MKIQKVFICLLIIITFILLCIILGGKNSSSDNIFPNTAQRPRNYDREQDPSYANRGRSQENFDSNGEFVSTVDYDFQEVHDDGFLEDIATEENFTTQDFEKIELSSDFIAKRNVLEAALPTISTSNRHTLVINRQKYLETSYKEVMKLSAEEYKRSHLEIRYKGEYGMDVGGLSKDWMESCISNLLHDKTGLFVRTGDNTGAIPIDIFLLKADKNYYRFLGRLIGRMILKKYNCNLYLDDLIYKMILNKPIVMEDYRFADETLYRNLELSRENPEPLDLYFTDMQGRDLIKNGSQIPVTKQNVDNYIIRLLKSKYNDDIKEQVDLIKLGLYETIDKPLLDSWSSKDLRLLLCGHRKINVKDWKMKTRYKGDTKNQIVIFWFWEVVEEFTDLQKSRLLHFITGSSMVPPGGFGDFRNSNGGFQQFTIELETSYRLPVAHTCFNTLNLGTYKSKARLKRDLEEAIANSYQGFHLA